MITERFLAKCFRKTGARTLQLVSQCIKISQFNTTQTSCYYLNLA
jgi:hypothetical protein